MSSLDREKSRRLKEASALYEKSLKAFKRGDITKDELKDRLRPYKYELKELGYPVRIKDDDAPVQETGKPSLTPPEAPVVNEEVAQEAGTTRPAFDVTPWSKRSQLTIEEMERRIDSITLTRRPSEKLMSMYQSRYGEELEPPLDLVPYTASAGPSAPSPNGPGPVQDAPAPAAGDDGAQKRPFWKGIFKGRRKT